MIKLFSIVLLGSILFSFTLSAQNNIEPAVYKVKDNKDLVIYAQPLRSAPQKGVIPQGQKAFVFSTSAPLSATVDGQEGYWWETYYKGEYGYVFNGDLALEPEIDFMYPVVVPIYIINDNLSELPLRKKEKNKATALASIKKGEPFYVFNEDEKVQKTIQTDKGGLVKVRYKDKIGYVAWDAIMDYQFYVALKSIKE